MSDLVQGFRGTVMRRTGFGGLDTSELSREGPVVLHRTPRADECGGAGQAGEGREEESEGVLAASQSAAAAKSGSGAGCPRGDFREHYGVRG